MNITHHKNGKIKTLVEEAPFHPGYEDAGFEPIPFAGFVKIQNELTDEEINAEMLAYLNSKTMSLEDFARAILRKAQKK
jgi:dTDP-4-dehydrorhamnose reductase